MSYNLFLTPDDFDADAIRAHFAARPNYKVFDEQAWYENEDTGVYFSFDIVASPEPSEDEHGNEVKAEPHLAFNLNYYRPHVFALEAEPELAAFLAAFRCCIEDPQAEGMGEGPYTREGFLRGWTHGNRFAFRAAGRNATPPPPWPADPALIEAIWLWNFRRVEMQAEVGDRVFVPKLRWAVEGEAEPVACASWTEGVPALIPEELVTHVLMIRQPRPSIRNILGAITGKGQGAVELKLVTLDAVRADPDVAPTHIDGQPVLRTPQSCAIITPGTWPSASIRILPPEEICDADLVALMR